MRIKAIDFAHKFTISTKNENYKSDSYSKNIRFKEISEFMAEKSIEGQCKRYVISSYAMDVIQDPKKEISYPEYISMPFKEIQIYIPKSKECMEYYLYCKEDIDSEIVDCVFKIGAFQISMSFPLDISGDVVDLCVDFAKSKCTWRGKTIALSERMKIDVDESGLIAIQAAISQSIKVMLGFISIVSSSEVVYGSSALKIRAKMSGKVVKIKDFIHISTKRYLNSNKSSQDRNIEWSHGFWVCGHWRRTKDNKLGKNRSGQYVVNGKTWIKEHTRKDDLGIVEKTRVL